MGGESEGGIMATHEVRQRIRGGDPIRASPPKKRKFQPAHLLLVSKFLINIVRKLSGAVGKPSTQLHYDNRGSQGMNKKRNDMTCHDGSIME